MRGYEAAVMVDDETPGESTSYLGGEMGKRVLDMLSGT